MFSKGAYLFVINLHRDFIQIIYDVILLPCLFMHIGLAAAVTVLLELRKQCLCFHRRHTD